MNADNLPSTDERHEKGFSGVWIPWFVFKLVEEKRLKANEALIFAVIHSFSNENKCFASNAHLAKCVGLSEERVRKLIATLKSVGLVKQSSFDGRRRKLTILYDGFD